MSAFDDPPAWVAPSEDPADRQFGDVVERTSLADAAEYDAVIVGEPYDGAVIGRQGAREGPAALREALAGVKTHHFAAGDVAAIGDLGDVAVLHEAADAPVETVQRDLRAVTERVHAADAFPVFLGGDNSLTVANVSPLLSETVGVVNFDAHLDVREVRTGPTSGTPYRQLLDAGLAGYAAVGARHFETSGEYAAAVERASGEIVTAEDVADDPAAAVDRTLDSLGAVEAVYVSVDLDVLDATAAPGVSAPTPGGLTTRELFAMLHRVAGDDRVVGVEVVECAPPLDEGGRTVDAGARAIAHVLAGRQSGGNSS